MQPHVASADFVFLPVQPNNFLVRVRASIPKATEHIVENAITPVMVGNCVQMVVALRRVLPMLPRLATVDASISNRTHCIVVLATKPAQQIASVTKAAVSVHPTALIVGEYAPTHAQIPNTAELATTLVQRASFARQGCA
jgi:hypothetical protein